MKPGDSEEKLLRSVALQNTKSILEARQRAEDELLRAKEALESKTRELAKSLALIRATLESTTDGILVTDGAGRVTGYNENFVEMWKFPSELMDSRDHARLLSFNSEQFADPARFLARVREIYATSPPDSYDVLATRDGRTIERFSKIQFVNGANVGRVWSFRDITVSRRAEEALREEAQILELLSETGATIASQLDLHGLLQAVTDAATRLSGAKFGAFFTTATDAEGESFVLFTLSGAPREAFERFGVPRNTPLFDATFRGLGVVRSADITKDERYGRMTPHNGMPTGHLPVRSYLAVPVFSRSGHVIGGLFFGHPERGVFTEKTERLIVGVAAQASIAVDNARLYDDVKRLAKERELLLEAERAARSQAERASAQKDEFLANVSHELRTPLTAILGWSHLIDTGKLDESELRKGLETIARNARVQAQLIEDLLDMSRIAAGTVRLDVQRVDLASVVELATSTVRPSANAKGIRLRTIVDPRAEPVSGDPGRLQQVVWNLLSNAVKFTSTGGSIDVRLRPVNRHVEIAVSDTGVGIKAEFLPHVFERFRQEDSTTTRSHGGLGLGLAIVRKLVELHGGTIRATSEGEGKGATFVVRLPAASARGGERSGLRAAAAAPILEWEADLDGIRILVVEDDPDALDVIRRVLVKCRADVFDAPGASQALKLLRERKPDILVSDIGMPEIDGYQFIRQVRRLPASEGGSIPAIALTAFARSEDRTRALMAGFQMHVAKPIEPQELVATVASLSGRAESR